MMPELRKETYNLPGLSLANHVVKNTFKVVLVLSLEMTHCQLMKVYFFPKLYYRFYLKKQKNTFKVCSH
jgi:hypothetical protein